MAVIGVGIDIIEIERIRAALDRGGQRLLDRLFTPEEAAYCSSRRSPERHFAARFAATASHLSLSHSGTHAVAVVVLT